MIKILIYDTDSSHHNTVKSTVEHYASVDVDFHRIYNGFQGPYHLSILDYCLSNDIDIVVIPWSGIWFDPYLFGKNNIMVILPFRNNRNIYSSMIQVAGGETSAVDPAIVTQPLLDFYSEVSNLSGSSATASSYVCGKVAGLAANLLDDDYDIWEARQILRQNCDSFNDWSIEDGFGKLPDVITIPDPILDHPAVGVIVPPISSSSLNPGLGVLSFNAPGGSFNFDDGNGGINALESPYIIEGGDKIYNISFNTQYGNEFTHIEFELGEYTPKNVPKKVEVFYFNNSPGNRRFHIGNTSTSSFIPSEREGDRVEYRVYDNEDVLLHQGLGSWNSPVISFASWNNPDFSLNNQSGNTYKFQFRFVNLYGEGEWSELATIIDDEEDRSEAFDFTQEPLPDPEPDPEPEIFPENKLSLKNITLRNAEVLLNGETLFEVLNEKQTVDIDLENFKSLVIRKNV